MNFEEICKSKLTPLNPESVLVEFLKHNSQVFKNILKNREDLYKELLDIILEKEEKILKEFISWYRDYLYNY